MHYKINDEIIVKSENAAKSYHQPNKHVLDVISNLSNVDCALDYGCGKLRYTIALCKIAEKVIAVDSQIQISRIQMLWGYNTSAKEYSKNISNLRVYSIDTNDWKKQKYDFILCSNVLSAIPCDIDRMEILKNIKILLNPKGMALITTQYRNSYFSSYATRNNAFKFHDGWIIKRKSTYSFYGLLNAEKIREYCTNADLIVDEMFLHDGSAFILVK